MISFHFFFSPTSFFSLFLSAYLFYWHHKWQYIHCDFYTFISNSLCLLDWLYNVIHSTWIVVVAVGVCMCMCVLASFVGNNCCAPLFSIYTYVLFIQQQLCFYFYVCVCVWSFLFFCLCYSSFGQIIINANIIVSVCTNIYLYTIPFSFWLSIHCCCSSWRCCCFTCEEGTLFR